MENENVYLVYYPYWFEKHVYDDNYAIFTSLDLAKDFVFTKIVKEYKKQTGKRKLTAGWFPEQKDEDGRIGEIIVSDVDENEEEIIIYEKKLNPKEL